MSRLGRNDVFLRLLPLCLLAALFATTRTAVAQEGRMIVVAPYGREGARGDLADPLRTIESGIERAQPGDMVLVRAGVYRSPWALDAPVDIKGVHGTAERPIRLLGEYGAPRPTRLGSGWQVIRVFQSSYINIENFELVGTALSDQAPTAGVEIRESHHIGILGNAIHDVGGAGVSAIESDNIRVQGNQIWGATKWSPYQTSAISLFESRDSGHGMAFGGFNNIVYGNIAWGNRTLVKGPQGLITDGNCIIIDSNRSRNYPHATLIQNNVCVDHGGRGINVFHSDNVLAVNNTLTGNVNRIDQPGAELNAVAAANVTFRNNLVTANRPDSVTLVSDSVNVSFDHNLFVGNAPRTLGSADAVTASLPLDSGAVPPWGSIVVDRGSVEWAPQLDVYGTPRRGKPDIGAVER